jgi:hypothetical protein
MRLHHEGGEEILRLPGPPRRASGFRAHDPRFKARVPHLHGGDIDLVLISRGADEPSKDVIDNLDKSKILKSTDILANGWYFVPLPSADGASSKSRERAGAPFLPDFSRLLSLARFANVLYSIPTPFFPHLQARRHRRPRRAAAAARPLGRRAAARPVRLLEGFGQCVILQHSRCTLLKVYITHLAPCGMSSCANIHVLSAPPHPPLLRCALLIFIPPPSSSQCFFPSYRRTYCTVQRIPRRRRRKA